MIIYYYNGRLTFMNYWYFSFFIFIRATDIDHVRKFDVQLNERIQLECILTSKTDADGVDFHLKIHSI